MIEIQTKLLGFKNRWPLLVNLGPWLLHRRCMAFTGSQHGQSMKIAQIYDDLWRVSMIIYGCRIWSLGFCGRFMLVSAFPSHLSLSRFLRMTERALELLLLPDRPCLLLDIGCGSGISIFAMEMRENVNFWNACHNVHEDLHWCSLCLHGRNLRRGGETISGTALLKTGHFGRWKCQRGQLLVVLVQGEGGHLWVGYDISPSMLKIAKSREAISKRHRSSIGFKLSWIFDDFWCLMMP